MSTFSYRRDLNFRLHPVMLTGGDTEVQRWNYLSWVVAGLWQNWDQTPFVPLLWGEEREIGWRGWEDRGAVLVAAVSQAEGGHLTYSTLSPRSFTSLYSSPCLSLTQSKVQSLLWCQELSHRGLAVREAGKPDGLSPLGMPFSTPMWGMPITLLWEPLKMPLVASIM